MANEKPVEALNFPKKATDLYIEKLMLMTDRLVMGNKKPSVHVSNPTSHWDGSWQLRNISSPRLESGYIFFDQCMT